jgi:2-polyprenyl-3-methyl-5-hydroxy-6-metoxy-1,4-benzoquinol methylase
VTDRPSPDFPEHASAAAGAWERIAEWWDDRIGDGNDTQDLLVEPTQERLLGLQPGARVLDVACGAGRFTRRLAAAGALVTAFDQAASFIGRARRRTPPELASRIDYRVLDAGDAGALIGAAQAPFDAAVCTMALQDMAAIGPLASALPRLLKRPGRFVFSVPHPVFNSGDARIVGEEVYRDRRAQVVSSVRVTDYLTLRVVPGVGISGQPEEHPYFHRPIGVLLNTFLDQGLVLDRIEEPALPPDPGGDRRRLGWSGLQGIPQVLVARLVLPG